MEMITKIEKTDEFFVTASPNDLRRIADSLQYAIDHREERGHIRADERIISGDIEIVFVGDLS